MKNGCLLKIARVLKVFLDYKNGMEKRNQTAGELIYSTLMSWSCQNRYGFKVCCVSNKNDFASILIKKCFIIGGII